MKRIILCTAALFLLSSVSVQAKVAEEQIYKQERLKPVDSKLKVKVGEKAPDFTLPSTSGKRISLSDYRGKKNVVISFVPAAFTPICSDQWPGYNIARELFEMHDAIILGITTDNVPSLHAWTSQMGDGGVWFPVLSDFNPHGEAAGTYGVLRPEGISERAIIIVDKNGMLRYIDVHDINKRPDLGGIIKGLEKLN
ncbi:peroxiredoxin [Desulfovibrio sp. JC010]|uniref:peroxiredoxin n=1 Tax=Desulfovibrio sp. JC010 TaxID=2593641 RepID=UPI0013D366AF|nr:peroxiredoxin [Desulfovibrio sp. JC010]NDV25928.1 peroxiredoxin [Desulfovibrio sp. JC010]